MRVLYVEDNPANVFLVKRVAKMGNHEIINYIDGGQALKKFDEIKPDIVLMDIQLAGDIGGLDVVRELRKRGTTIPIIAVTAYAMVGDKERCMEAGCNDYLAKPLPVPRLVEIFQEYSEKVITMHSKDNATVSAVSPAAEKTKTNSDTKKEEDKTVVSPSQIEDTNVATTAQAAETKVEQSSEQASKADAPKQAEAQTTKADTPKQAEAQTTKADAPKQAEAQKTKAAEQATENSGSDNKTETATDTVEKVITGTLSKEDTVPVTSQTEAEVSKESSESSTKS